MNASTKWKGRTMNWLDKIAKYKAETAQRKANDNERTELRKKELI